MTRQATFKAKIRARMAKTGERYAAARLALLQQGPPRPARGDIRSVPGYTFAPLIEQDTGLLALATAQAGAVDPGTGSAFTAERLFGLSGGIGFMYFLFEYRGEAPMMTFTCRSWSLPGPVIDRALATAGIEHQRSETGSGAAAERWLDDALAAGRCVHLTLDAASLPGSGFPAAWSGQLPRQANVVGRVGSRYLVDTGAVRELAGDELARARAAPRKERHRAVTIAPGPASGDPVAATLEAARRTAERYLEAPFKGYASNFGLAGIAKLARLCSDTKDAKGWPRVFDSGPLAYLALLRTWECLTIELTPPAGGRGFYAGFLQAASEQDGMPAASRSALREGAEWTRASAERLAQLADEVIVLGGPGVARGVAILEELEESRSGAAPVAEERIDALLAERRELSEAYALDAAERREAFARIGAAFADVHTIETELQRALASA